MFSRPPHPGMGPPSPPRIIPRRSWRSLSRTPPRLDDLDIRDEAMVDYQVDLLEYLDREDNPDPDYHPPVRFAAGAESHDAIPSAGRRSPPPTRYHEHSRGCPYKWKPPSLKEIYRQPGRRQLLDQAGILNFIAYNYPKVKRRFIEEEWRDITWSEDSKVIVVAPRLPPPPGSRSPFPALPPLRVEVSIALLQRMWPGLPSTQSHRAYDLAIPPAPTDLAIAPDPSNVDFIRQALVRYFALALYEDDEGAYGVIMDTCFHMPLYRFLLRLGYIFGWRGYGRTFPERYFPMALMTFVSGAQYAWADLLLRELIYDVQHRRLCPSMVRVWKAIWDFVVAESRNQPHVPAPERRYLYVPFLKQCRDANQPYDPIGLHYHTQEISQWTPQSYRNTLESGACMIDDCDLP